MYINWYMYYNCYTSVLSMYANVKTKVIDFEIQLKNQNKKYKIETLFLNLTLKI